MERPKSNIHTGRTVGKDCQASAPRRHNFALARFLFVFFAVFARFFGVVLLLLPFSRLSCVAFALCWLPAALQRLTATNFYDGDGSAVAVTSPGKSMSSRLKELENRTLGVEYHDTESDETDGDASLYHDNEADAASSSLLFDSSAAMLKPQVARPVFDPPNQVNLLKEHSNGNDDVDPDCIGTLDYPPIPSEWGCCCCIPGGFPRCLYKRKIGAAYLCCEGKRANGEPKVLCMLGAGYVYSTAVGVVFGDGEPFLSL